MKGLSTAVALAATGATVANAQSKLPNPPLEQHCKKSPAKNKKREGKKTEHQRTINPARHANTSPTAAHTPNIDWAAAHTKASAALAQLNQTEKIGIVTGVGWGNGPCVGNTYAVPKIGYPSLCLQDGPLGVRYAANVSALPAGIQAASTWDRELIYQRGLALGKEAKGLGIHVQLGPVAGALGKVSFYF